MSNFRALAVVTATLEHVLQDAANQAVGQADVRVGAPTAKLAEDGSPLINLFLFRVLPNTQHRNDHFPSRDGGGKQRARARVHLDLHYVLSFYGDAAKFEPERLYGAAALALEHAPGLSVAAISYYVVGLFGHVLDGLHGAGIAFDTNIAKAVFVPIAVIAIWWTVRRIRRRHISGSGVD